MIVFIQPLKKLLVKIIIIRLILFLNLPFFGKKKKKKTVDKEKTMEIKEMDDKLMKDEFKLKNLEERRLGLLEFFEKNRVPIECKEKEIHVFSAKIEAPYVSTSVICENSLVRKRVRDLMIDFDRLFSKKE
ncbi:unnamed protein product [Rhizopus stolonifer]